MSFMIFVGKSDNGHICLLQAEYPKMISKGFPGIPESGLDAAFVWGGNNKIYFFQVPGPSGLTLLQGNQYWKFDIEKTPNVRLDIYPKVDNRIYLTYTTTMV